MKSKLFILITILMVIFSLEVKAGKFTDNGDETVTDNITGLMWQQGAPIKNYGYELGDTGQEWKESIQYCEDLSLAGHDDWRLPNRKEFKSIMEYKLDNPSVYMRYFPNTAPEYWTSTISWTRYGHWKMASTAYFTRGEMMRVVVDERSEKPPPRFWTRCVRQDK